MNRLFHFGIGLLSTQGFFNLLRGYDVSLLQEGIVSLIGGICSAILIAWLRHRWEDRERGDLR